MDTFLLGIVITIISTVNVLSLIPSYNVVRRDVEIKEVDNETYFHIGIIIVITLLCIAINYSLIVYGDGIGIMKPKPDATESFLRGLFT